LVGFTDVVNKHLNQKDTVLALFIDFSRAFDTLQHKHLITKLDRCGLRGPTLKWCENYLQNRKFNVKIGESLSESVVTTVRTAQGSVIGPLHFLSYVNDMSTCIQNGTCFQFADDTCLLVADKDPQKACDLLQSDLNSLLRWWHDLRLVVNSSKTKLMVIQSPYLKRNLINCLVAHNHSCLHSSHNGTCQCPQIEVVKTIKYLGLTIDDKFN
jgi:hypothetical protein